MARPRRRLASGRQVAVRNNHPLSLLFPLRWFTKYGEMDYARAGNKATFTVNLDPGPLEQFPHSMEPQLRQLGLPTTLKKGTRGGPAMAPGLMNPTRVHEDAVLIPGLAWQFRDLALP